MSRCWLVVFCIGAVCADGCRSAMVENAESSEASLLRDWALSRCLAKAAKDERFGEDAAQSAAALLERGNAGIANYEKLDALVDSFIARRYTGSVPGEYLALKCIDLFHSRELEDAVRRMAK